MASFSKSRSMSKKQSAPLVAAPDEDEYDNWDDSLRRGDDDDDDFDFDDDWEDDGNDGTTTPAARRKSVKNAAKFEQKVIVQVARSGELTELQQLLNEIDAGEKTSSISGHDAKNYSALHYAAHSDNLEMVKLLVKHGADVNDVGESDRRPLHLAACAMKDQTKVDAVEKVSKLPENVDDGVVKVLLSHGADANAEDSRGRTPLHIATLQGNTEAVLQLLSKDDIDLNKKDNRSTTPLLLACLYGKIDIALRLIEKGADLTVYDDDYDTPLHIAFRVRYKKVARRIIEKAKKTEKLKEILIETNRYGVAPIHLAVREGFKELVEISLDHVLKKDQTDAMVQHDDFEDVVNYGGAENDDTPLHEASGAGHLEMVKLLLDKGAKINITNWDSETPLHHACKENRRKVAEFLVENGADLSAKNDEDLTPLQVAANFKSFDTIIDLLDRHRNLDTSTTANDDQDTALELIKWTAAENKAEALQLLLHRGSKLHGVNDDVIVEFVLDASKKGHTETVAALIRWKRSDVVGTFDKLGNTPLHLASEAGHDQTVQELIRAKANVNDSNFDEALKRTPLHLAAANGWIRTVKQLLKAKAKVDETDLYDITPLHLACENGHVEMVKLLIYEQNADIVVRDQAGRNCLDCAIDNGHKTIANLILSHDKWHEVMSVSSLGDDEFRTTPMRKLIRTMPDIAERVMDKCVKVSPNAGPRDSDFWIEFDYEFLDDTFSLWDIELCPQKKSVDEDEEKEEKDEDDKEKEEKNDRDDNHEDHDESEETSFITEPTGHNDIQITPKENGDRPSKLTPEYDIDDCPFPSGPQYDDKGHLLKSAKWFTNFSRYSAVNHPLNIMVSSERTDLLSHPLVSSLLIHKWSRVGLYFFLFSFGFYLLFVAMLTGYVIVVPPSFYVRHANESGATWFVNGEERWTRGFDEATIFFFGRIGDWIILILSLVNLLRELSQLCLQRRAYFSFGNLIEWSLYILAILLVLPLSGVQYFMGVSIRLDWQWQCGAVAVFLAWINLILFIRRFPGLGIYVIMFIDILRTFMKFVLILILFVIAFALAFYTLLMNQQPFHSVPHSFAKTFVMMIGELDFGNIFHSQNYLGTENTLDDGEEDFFLYSVFYEGITYAIFLLFLIIMSIVIMNLLVGLAVDDIHAIQKKAKLHRLAMQVELVMEVQRALPVFIWRSSILRFKRFSLNRSGGGGLLQKWYRTFTGDQGVLLEAIRVCNKSTTQGEFKQEQATTDELFANLKYRLKMLGTKMESMNGGVEQEKEKREGEMSQVRDEQKQTKERLDRLEKKIDALLSHENVKWDQESKTDSK